MTLPEATTKSHVALRRCKLRAATAVLCLLSIGFAQASGSLKHSAHSSKSKSAKPAIASISLKDKLLWLRDFTSRNFLPAHNTLGTQVDWDDGTHLQFDGERQLFKPVSNDTYSDSLKKIIKQDLGLQIGPHTQFQCDFQRFWTADDKQEVSVKMGLRFGFR